jgi:hypothetical protein
MTEDPEESDSEGSDSEGSDSEGSGEPFRENRPQTPEGSGEPIRGNRSDPPKPTWRESEHWVSGIRTRENSENRVIHPMEIQIF